MADISYRIELADLHAHEYAVTLTVPAPDAEQTVSLPAWIPGSYLLREFSRHLSGLGARQGQREVAVEQLDKATWRVRCNGRAALVLRYRIYAFDPSVRAAFLDAERGFFNGTSLCLRVHGREQGVHRLELARLPEGWRVATTMRAVGAAADAKFEAADYDELVDHPFELGRFWVGSFVAAGIEHRFAVAGALPVFDGDRLLEDARKICEAQIAFWHGGPSRKRGTPPFAASGYLFMLNAVDDGYGGLEHRASTALIAARRDLPRLAQPETSDGYVKLLGLISHEYFHSWNVKRLRPAEFASYDYAQENYTELLWFFEGFTSYYDDLLLVRAGLIDEMRYLKLLATTVSGVLAAPGRLRQSLAQSSFDAWVKYYRQDENTPNSTVSYYAKGALVALALDLSLRSEAVKLDGGQASLDCVMRRLWRRHGGPITEDHVLAQVAELGGPELGEALRQWVHGTADLPLPALLERLGVQWRADKPNLGQRLGLRTVEAPGGVAVKQVLAGSAAQAGGLSAGDEIVGCNGWRLRRLDDLALTLSTVHPARLDLLVARDQRLFELKVELPTETAAPVLLSPADKAAARAVGLRRAWLGG